MFASFFRLHDRNRHIFFIRSVRRVVSRRGRKKKSQSAVRERSEAVDSDRLTRQLTHTTAAPGIEPSQHPLEIARSSTSKLLLVTMRGRDSGHLSPRHVGLDEDRVL